jgi:hypothetical protein
MLAESIRRRIPVVVAAACGSVVRAQGVVEVWEPGSGVANFARTLASAGDMDGDGRGDFALAHDWTQGKGRVDVYSGASLQPLYVFHGAALNAGLGRAIEPLGDLDGDGFGELAIGAPGQDRVVVVSGAFGDVIRDWQGLPNGDGLGAALALLGDVQGDGWPDLAVTAFDAQPSRVLFLSGYDGAILRELSQWPPQSFGERLAAGGDADGDGIGDLLIASTSDIRRVYLHSGATGALLRTFLPHDAQPAFPDGIAFVPDLDGDERADVAIGDTDADTTWTDTGAVRIYSGATGQVLRTLSGGPYEKLGLEIEPIADADGDGVEDLLLSAAGSNLASGYVTLVSGASGAQIQRLGGAGAHVGGALAALPDVDLDGHVDYLARSWRFGNDPTVLLVTAGTSSGASYCVAKIDSAGCQPRIAGAGTPSLTGPDDFRITSSQVQSQRAGLLFWGYASSATSFSGGKLCVASPQVRTAGQFSGGNPNAVDCSGAFDLPLSNAYFLAKGVLPGQVLHAQYWSRDPGNPPPGNVSLSDGWAWTVAP